MKKELMTVEGYLVAEKIEQKAFDAMPAEEQAEIANKVQKNNHEVIEEMLKANATAEEVAKAQAEIATENQKQIVIINGAVQKMLKSLNTISKGKVITEAPTLKSEIAGNKDKLKGLAMGSEQHVELKAITNVAVVTDNETTSFVPGLSPLNTQKLTAESLFSHRTISGDNVNKSIYYMDWDAASVVRSAATIAESGTYPQSDVKFIRKTADIKKIGDSMAVTDEFYEDEAMFSSELDLFLRTNMLIESNEQIINGDGIGENLTGVNTTALTFVAAASGIAQPNIADLCYKMREQMKALGQKFDPNFVIMNSEVASTLELEKDGNNNYIKVPFVTDDMSSIKSMVVVIDEAQANNTLVIGDSRYGVIHERIGLQLSRAMVGTQFLTDETTLKVRRRLLFLIKDSDAPGFLKCIDVDAALITLAL